MTDKNTLQNKFKGCLYGSIVGDALGAPYEFKNRGSYQASIKYGTGGSFNLRKGEWTDDTSMSLCTIASITEKGKVDYEDLMEKWYKWYKDGYMSSRDVCYDIGMTTSRSLMLYKHTKELFSGPSHSRFSGNGGIMRFGPVAVYCYNKSKTQQLKLGEDYSSLTHPSRICKYSARLLMKLLQAIFNNPKLSKIQIVKMVYNDDLTNEMKEIIVGALSKKEEEISASGFVVNSLEAAIFAFLNSKSFIDGLHMIINMGEDTDTVGAIYGQIAGAYYGINGIDNYYIDNLYKKDMIRSMIDGFVDLALNS